ncbi:MAG: chloride channel protein [Chromatiaceae bacterium]
MPTAKWSFATSGDAALFKPLFRFFGLACRLLFPSIEIDPEAFTAVAMAAFFAGVVRASVTGIALVTEMTGSTALLLPMVAASFTAMVVPTFVGNPPVYDSLGRRASRLNRSPTTTTSRSTPD